MSLGGHKGKKKPVLCRPLKPPVIGMNLLLDIFSQERDFRCLMSDGMERHPTLSRAERKLILFDIYKIDWFVIETHFTKTVP